MNTPLSARDQEGSATSASRASDTTTVPVTLSEPSLTGLALIRIFVGSLWFQQLSWKMPPTFQGAHIYLVKEALYTILPGYSYIVQHVFLPNFVPLLAIVWTAELVVALSLIFGFITRFGALLSVLLALQLYIGLAFAPGEWYWTYGMLILLGLIMAAIPTGRRLGFDQLLAPRLQVAANRSRIARVLSWLA